MKKTVTLFTGKETSRSFDEQFTKIAQKLTEKRTDVLWIKPHPSLEKAIAKYIYRDDIWQWCGGGDGLPEDFDLLFEGKFFMEDIHKIEEGVREAFNNG